MITTRLHGRLGNQMFQYAAARALAGRLGTGVALDSRDAKRRGEGVLTRVFDLPVVEPVGLPPTRHQAPFRYGMWRALGRNPVFHRERGLGFNREITSWGDGSYLHGYWQSEQYFGEYAEDIRKDFRFPGFSDERNKDMGLRIGQENLSISLHVRRGDYVALDAHGVCDQQYYEAALEAVLDGLSGKPVVYVFSDDPGWVRGNLELPCEKVVVDFNGSETDFEDMRLMSLCQHNIIGNSSFSWWGAWLNANQGKRVAGPARWFGDPKMSNPDILPPEWLEIAS